MNTWFDLDPWVLSLCGLAALIAIARLLHHAHRHRRWLIGLQLPLTLLLLAALLLRDAPSPSGMIVLTAGAKLDALPASSQRAPTLALPGAFDITQQQRVQDAGIATTPDLATALRRYPQTTHVHVLGNGLGMRDREALGQLDLSFAAAPEPDIARVTELQAPVRVVSGQRWQVTGRVAGAATRVELLDPAQQRITRTTPDTHGRFALQGLARAAGTVLFELRVLDADDESTVLPLPIQAIDPAPLRALLLAGHASAELKYFRRWAADAGLQLQTRIALAPGLALGAASTRLDPQTLAQLDLLIVDERSWAWLAAQQDQLRSAIEQGMGLLIRITAPVPERTLQQWRALGIDLQVSDAAPRAVQLDAGTPGRETEALHAWNVTPQSDRSVHLWQDANAQPLAIQSTLGQGRIGALWLTDGFRLHTRGDAARHATLWSGLISSIARARAPAPATFSAPAVVGQRVTVCRAEGELTVATPARGDVQLVRDPAKSDCAGFWPTSMGWHRLYPDANTPMGVSSTGAAPEATSSAQHERAEQTAALAFYVHAPEQIHSLIAAADRRATTALVNRSDEPRARAADRQTWRAIALLLWLGVMSLVWWLERRVRRAA